MAPASGTVRVLSPLRAGTGNATRVSPAPVGRSPVDRQVREGQRPAPDPAGAKRPPWAGRALAGGFGPRPVLIPAQRCGRGDGPCQRIRGSAFAPSGGNRKHDPRSPRPRGTVPCRPACPGRTEARARVRSGAGTGAMVPARMCRARAGARGSRFALRQPLRWPCLRHPVSRSALRHGRARLSRCARQGPCLQKRSAARSDRHPRCVPRH